MQWQLIVVLGLVISAILFLAAIVLYLNMHDISSAVQRVLRLRVDNTRYRYTARDDCRG
jgi:hypothetical protein